MSARAGGDMQDKKAYLREMAKLRGFVMDHHKVLLAEDDEFLRSLNDFVAASQTRERRLDRQTKEYIMIGALMALGAMKNHIKAHMEVAKKEGATKEDILEVLEVLALMCGMPRFMMAYEAWKECFEVRRIELD
jgi:4-carboxymuconolactone decarboxylase